MFGTMSLVGRLAIGALVTTAPSGLLAQSGASIAVSDWQGEWSSQNATIKLRVTDGLAYGDYVSARAVDERGAIVGVVGRDGGLKGTLLRDGVATYFSFSLPSANSFQAITSAIGGTATRPTPATFSRVSTQAPSIASSAFGLIGAEAFSGTWQSTFGDLRLHRVGDTLVGDYRDLGVMVGKTKLSGSNYILEGVFNNGSQVGSFELSMPRENPGTWTGRWKWHGEPAWRPPSDPWNATKTAASAGPLSNITPNVQWAPAAVVAARDARPVYDGRPGDACGPQNAADYLVPDGIFLSACVTHDACYRGQVKNQDQCDRDFLVQMRAKCEDTFGGIILTVSRQLCFGAARVYYWAVAGTTGANAYGGGQIGGRIVGMTATSLPDTEQEGCVRIRNPTNRVMEYDVTLFASDGTSIDTRPKFSEEDIGPGREKIICVHTKDHPRNRNNLGATFSMVVRLDDPDASFFAGVSDSDWVTIDRAVCTIRTNTCIRK